MCNCIQNVCINLKLFQRVVGATMEVYQQAVVKFLPIPAKSHYTFNLRDFARVMYGIVLVPPQKIPEPENLFRLWVHETLRVFSDRLVDQGDR